MQSRLRTGFFLLSVGLAGCAMRPVPSTEQNISTAEQVNTTQITAAEQARQVCLQFGAKPGSRMFYTCMKEQTEAAQYNIALAACKSSGYSHEAKRECLEGGSGLFGLRGCLQKKEQDCEANAKLAYLPDSNVQKIEQSNHQYIHTYKNGADGQ
ncbi:hypothetical protein [Thiomonas sp.]